MGNALLIQFPDLRFERRLIPFISSVEEARRVVAILDAAADGPVAPLAFSTTAVEEVRQELLRTKCPLIDFFGMHMDSVESILGAKGIRVAARLHGMGDVKRYNARMAAVEYAIEHDDGQSMRALDKADVILLAPSRCGKTPTTMYLALQHGIFVANYPLVDEDFESAELPRPVRGLRNRCFGLTTTPARLSQVRNERRPNSRYASFEQCSYELREAEAMYRNHRQNDVPILVGWNADEGKDLAPEILATSDFTAAGQRELTISAKAKADKTVFISVRANFEVLEGIRIKETAAPLRR